MLKVEQIVLSCFAMQLLKKLPKENLKLFYQMKEINIFLINIRHLLRANNMDYKYLINKWYRCPSYMGFIAVKIFQR